MFELNLKRKKKAKAVLHGFAEIVNESKRKPNKLWVDQGNEFYNNLTQKNYDNDISMYLTHNEGRSVVAKRFIKTLKDKYYNKRQLMIVNLILVI